jgi:hypothetical protein
MKPASEWTASTSNKLKMAPALSRRSGVGRCGLSPLFYQDDQDAQASWLSPLFYEGAQKNN